MIKINNLTCKEESGTPLISGASFEIQQNDRVAILGSDQERITILCRILGGILHRLHPAHTVEGSVLYNDQPVDSLDSHERTNRIAYVPSDSELLISGVKDTVFGEIALSLELSGTVPDEIRKRVSRILRRMGIGHLTERDPDELSGGERHKVALASMIVREPEVLILDNPSMYLDMSGVHYLRTILKNYRGTIIIADPNPYIWSDFVQRFILVEGTGISVCNSVPELLRISERGETEYELPAWIELYMKLRHDVNLKNQLNTLHSLPAVRAISGVIR